MTVLRRLSACLLALAMAGPAAAAPERDADGAVRLVVGQPNGPSVTLTFSPDRGADDALTIESRRVGVAGSSLELRIDRSGTSLYSTLLTDDQCAFGDGGSSCRVEIPGGTSTYDAVVLAFRKGRNLHVQIQNAGNMLMSRDASLIGFTRVYAASAPAS